jgi:hypothetical protein
MGLELLLQCCGANSFIEGCAEVVHSRVIVLGVPYFRILKAFVLCGIFTKGSICLLNIPGIAM